MVNFRRCMLPGSVVDRRLLLSFLGGGKDGVKQRRAQ